jgi:hypothetical protein
MHPWTGHSGLEPTPFLHRCTRDDLMRKLLLALVVAASASCSSTRDANTENFAAAIRADANHRDERLCIFVSAGLAPDREYSENPTLVPDEHDPQKAALISAGLITRVLHERGTYLAEYLFVFEYHNTDLGQRYAINGPSVVPPVYCYATVALDRIVNYTEPADAGGATASQVRFTYKVENVAPWALNPAVQQAFPDVPSYLARQSTEQSLTLWLTHDGWEVAPNQCGVVCLPPRPGT